MVYRIITELSAVEISMVYPNLSGAPIYRNFNEVTGGAPGESILRISTVGIT